jgi:hypothetical protein
MTLDPISAVLPLLAPRLTGAADCLTNDLIADLEACIARYMAAAPNKSFVSADGWSFLINDTNDFLRWLFGLKRWSVAQFAGAQQVLRARQQRVTEMGACFVKFIVPEKSALYARHLPGLLGHAPLYDARPANLLHRVSECPAIYLFERLDEMAKLGLTYLRGDSHPNWQGAYIIYQMIHETVSTMLPIGQPLALDELMRTAVKYGGDLFGQLPAGAADTLSPPIRLMQPPGHAEIVIKYTIDPARRHAMPCQPSEDYAKWFDTRETLTWQHRDRTLPRCVIFRDSTAEHFLDYLAEHFSRTVAVWWHGVVVEDVIAREKPDIVIQVQAERFLQLLPAARPTVTMARMRAAFAQRERQEQQHPARIPVSPAPDTAPK